MISNTSQLTKEQKFTYLVLFLITSFIALTIYYWSITFPFFIGASLAFLLNPLINFLEKKKIKRNISIVILTFTVFLFIGYALTLIIPTLIIQISKLINAFTHYWNSNPQLFKHISHFLESYNIHISEQDIATKLQGQFFKSAQGLLSSTADFLKISINIIKEILIIIITFFFSLKEKDKIHALMYSLIPQSNKATISHIIEHNIVQINHFIRGSIFVSVIIFIFMLLVLHLTSTPFATSLATFSGFVSIIPYVGPMIHAVVICVVQIIYNVPMFNILLMLFIQGIFYTVISFYIHPLVVGKSSHIHPFVIIFCVIVGGDIAGVLGMLISIPIFIVVRSVISNLFKQYSK